MCFIRFQGFLRACYKGVQRDLEGLFVGVSRLRCMVDRK